MPPNKKAKVRKETTSSGEQIKVTLKDPLKKTLEKEKKNQYLLY